MVIASLLACILFKYQALAPLLSIALPCIAIIGTFIFVSETYRTGIAIRRFGPVYRSLDPSGFRSTAVTSSLAVTTLAAFPVTAGFIGWHSSAA